MKQFPIGMIMLAAVVLGLPPPMAMAQQKLVAKSSVEAKLVMLVVDARGLFSTPASRVGLGREGKTVFGAPYCAQWLDQPTFDRKTWLIGFLSGYNIAWTLADPSAGDPLDSLVDEYAVYIWMTKWCKANPSMNVGQGAQHLYIQLSESNK